MDQLAGKVAVVTGGASGIGLGLARAFAAEGMKIVLADIEAAALGEAAEKLRASGADVLDVVTDVSVEDLGFDACINYKTEDVEARLRETCPDGIDVFFDNVGGEILDAVLNQINIGARIVMCGAISEYTRAESPGLKNYTSLIMQRGRMEGFIILDYLPRAAEGMKELAEWVMAGKLKDRVDVQEGLENAPKALRRLFSGENVGKQLVKVA